MLSAVLMTVESRAARVGVGDQQVLDVLRDRGVATAGDGDEATTFERWTLESRFANRQHALPTGLFDGHGTS